MQYLNKVICDDCANFLKKLPPNSIDLVITDPPYLTTDERWDKVEAFNQLVISHLKRVCKESASVYVWCGIGEKSQSLIRWFPLLKEKFHFKDLVTWKKQRGIGMRRGWLYTREELMWFVVNNKQFRWNKDEQYSNVDKYDKLPKGFKMKDGQYSGKYLKNKQGYKRLTNVWTDIVEESFNTKSLCSTKTGHSARKPEKAIERIMRVHTQENDVVLDPFFGLGGVGVVAKKLNRRFIGIDIDEEYCRLARERIYG